MSAQEQPGNRTKRWGCFSIGGAILGGLFLIGFIGSIVAPSSKTPGANTASSSPSSSDTQTEDASNGPTAQKAGPTSNWSYSEDKDAMRGTITKYAQIESDNELDFGFPYGSNKGQLMLRNRKTDGLSVILSVKGQFICNSFSGDTISVKFDDRPIEQFTCGEPSDGTPGVIFISSSARFLKRLRTASKVIVEAQYFEHGNQQLIFSVAGLRW